MSIPIPHTSTDPKHPNCLRNIAVEKGNPNAQISGTDGNPGCPPGGEGKTWALSGKVDGDSLLVDFSPKGGPKDLKGTWDGDGIRKYLISCCLDLIFCFRMA